MDNKGKICFVGGDLRISAAISSLSKLGFKISAWGIDDSYVEKSLVCSNISDALKDVSVLVLPTPPSEDEVRVNCPLFSGESGIKLHKLLDMISETTLVLGGRISPRLRDYAVKRGIKIIDYFNTDELLIKNAVPTAEGAIGIGIEKHPKTLFGSKIAIIGYGRVGEALAERLKMLGADVTVYARNASVIAKVQSCGMKGTRITYSDQNSSLEELDNGYDIIYNTVPYWLINEEIIKNMPRSTMVVELASAPGGVDILAAKKYGMEIIHAPSLPSKVAPVTAGKIIAESILNIIKEETVL